MRYSLITPTIVRPTLKMLCDTINAQLEKDWEHIILVDYPEESLSDEKKHRLTTISHPQRYIVYCEENHADYGHTCRYNAWDMVKGEYIFYVDDDDHFHNPVSLGKLNIVQKDWAIFPVQREGRRFFNIPPGIAKTGTGMFIHKKSIGRWPKRKDYEADGHFVCELMDNYEYETIHSGDPLIVQPRSNYGK
jgi:glycosyltransferase involved in cell wall biosynthesis